LSMQEMFPTEEFPMTMMSFETPTTGGWRYNPGWRTRKEANAWVLERWNGTDWQRLDVAARTYRELREQAAAEQARLTTTTFEQRLADENPDIPADEIAAHVEDIFAENPDLAF